MTYLGVKSPFTRLWDGVKGWMKPPRFPERPPRRSLVVGHRGAARYAAENTILSFKKAIELGADAVEVDICATRDGHFVAWHDAEPNDWMSFARRRNLEDLLYCPDIPSPGSPSRRAVRELDLATFREHYGYVLAKNDPALPPVGRVPADLLDDVLDWAEGEPKLKAICLDIKLEPKEIQAALSLYRRLADRLAGARPFDVNLLCPQKEICVAFRDESRRHAVPCLHVFGDYEFPGELVSARRLGLTHVSLGVTRRLWKGFRRDVGRLVRVRESGGLQNVVVWTFNDEERLRELVRFGVDGILTDDSTLLRRLVDEGNS